MTPKKVTTTKDPTIAWAEHLWERLESNLLDTQNTIIAIIDAKAWEPLGYESFSKAWVDRIMSKITIASELRPHVVYQMFDEGLTADQVADAVKGVGTDTAKDLKRQKDNGVPPGLASTVVRKHHRRKPAAASWIHLQVDPTLRQEWTRIAKSHGKTMESIALQAVTEAFNDLR